MRDEDFKKKLSEVAIWGIPTLEESVKTRGIKANRRRVTKFKTLDELKNIEDPDEYELSDDVDRDLLHLIKNDTNITYPPLVTEVKPKSIICDDCGNECPNGRHKEMKVHFVNSKRHWREYCYTCDRHKHPQTGKFELDPSIAGKTWNNYQRIPKKDRDNS